MKKLGLILLAMFFTGAAGAATTLKIATVTPEGSQWMQDMRATSAEIKAATDGRVVIKYYGGGSQGTDSTVLKRMSRGALHGGVFTPSALMERYPDIGLYGLPMVFDSAEDATYVRDRMDKKLAAGLEEAGFVSFGFAATGFAMMMSNEPVAGLEDLRGKRVWVPEGDAVSKATMDALGVNPIPLPLTDVYTALQTGALDIIAMSSVGAVILQYHTKLKYVTDLPLVYTMGLMVVDKRAFAKISAADQTIVRQKLASLYARYDVSNLEDEAEAKQALFNAGMQRIVPGEEQLVQLRSVLSKSNEAMAAKGIVSAEYYAEMMRYIKERRADSETIARADEKLGENLAVE
ncbi:MAG: TRAP transporter substrate-binding protein DctP [Woeseiaceae bacterium]